MAVFKELCSRSEILRALEQMGFTEPTPIQEQIIPLAQKGVDLIGQAQTGTGKTAAFGIPLIDRIDEVDNNVQGLVLAPTRELAVQVAGEINRISRYTSIRALAIYGGQEISTQIKSLKKKPQIIVATPGRFMDHMRRRTIRLQSIRTVVLDEADEMLSMGFIEDIETILNEVPKERQTLLFSATMPKRIREISQKFMVNPQLISVKTKEMTVSTIEQRYIEVPERQKFETLCHLLDINCPELAIVFGRTKRRVDELSDALNQIGYEAEGIHGDMRQEKRDRVLKRFKKGDIDILVATDVAARGLDISGVTHVFNFDLPQDPESYVHRIGRTGRAGNSGVAFTFVTPREMDHIKNIENTTKGKVKRQAIPTYEEVKKGRQGQAVETLKGVVQEGKYSDLQGAASTLLKHYDAVTLVSAALKMIIKEPTNTSIRLTDEAPLSVKKKKNKSNNYNRNYKTGGTGGNNRKRSRKRTTSRKEGV